MNQSTTRQADPNRLTTPNVVMRADQLCQGDVVVTDAWIDGHWRTVLACVDTTTIVGDDVIIDFTAHTPGQTTTSVGNTFVVVANPRLGRDLIIKA